jgi:hypothetical protein
MWKSITVPVIALLAVTSCTWVSLTRQGDNVRLVSVSEAQGCKNMGRTQVSLRDYIIDGIKRDPVKVERELNTLGRNSAAEMGGDTITPASEIVNGSRSFDVYKCMP